MSGAKSKIDLLNELSPKNCTHNLRPTDTPKELLPDGGTTILHSRRFEKCSTIRSIILALKGAVRKITRGN
jgi:hypothetical protein